MPRTERVRFASYNIHGCVGPGARFDPHRIVDVLKTIDADVVALQEVEASRFGGENVLNFLAGETSMTPVAGMTLKRSNADYGNALLTRLPVAAIERVDLSVSGREPRGLIDARLVAGDVQIRVMATHLGLRKQERRKQVGRLLAHLDHEPLRRTVLLGDFNEWWPWSGSLRRLGNRFSKSHAPASFPARFPLLCLDRIWICGDDGAVSAGRILGPGARQASDHLPVWLEAQW